MREVPGLKKKKVVDGETKEEKWWRKSDNGGKN